MTDVPMSLWQHISFTLLPSLPDAVGVSTQNFFLSTLVWQCILPCTCRWHKGKIQMKTFWDAIQLHFPSPEICTIMLWALYIYSILSINGRLLMFPFTYLIQYPKPDLHQPHSPYHVILETSSLSEYHFTVFLPWDFHSTLVDHARAGRGRRGSGGTKWETDGTTRVLWVVHLIRTARQGWAGKAGTVYNWHPTAVKL